MEKSYSQACADLRKALIELNEAIKKSTAMLCILRARQTIIKRMYKFNNKLTLKKYLREKRSLKNK